MNKIKFVQLTFTLKGYQSSLGYLNNIQIQQSMTIKYLEIHLKGLISIIPENSIGVLKLTH